MSTPSVVTAPGVVPVVQIGVSTAHAAVDPGGQWDVTEWDDPALSVWGGTDPLWRDVTCSSMRVESFEGRERALSRWDVGTATIEVVNPDGWADILSDVAVFDALQIRPGRQIRWGVAIDGADPIWLWRGYIDTHAADYEGRSAVTDVARFDCVDALGEVGRAHIVDKTAGAEIASTRITRLLNLVSWPATKRAINLSYVPIFAAEIDGQALDELTATADSAGGSIYGDRDGRIVFRHRHWQVWDPSDPPLAYVGNADPDAGDVVFTTEEWEPTALGASLLAWISPRDASTVTVAGGVVSQIVDKSSYGRVWTQTTGANQPAYGSRTLAGNAVLDFDGTNDSLSTTWVTNQPFTIGCVVEADALTFGGNAILGQFSSSLWLGIGNGPVWLDYLSAAPVSGGLFGGVPDLDPHYVVFICNGATSEIRVDGVSVAAGPGPTFQLGYTTKQAIGMAANTRYWNGAIGDIVWIDGAATGDDLTNLEAWLSALTHGTAMPAGGTYDVVFGADDVVWGGIGPVICPLRYELEFTRAGATNRSLVNYQGSDVAPRSYNDTVSQSKYGIETEPERLDMLTSSRPALDWIAERLVATQGAGTQPRIAAVVLNAGTSTEARDLMAAINPGLPTRWRCILQRDGRTVLDRNMFVVGVQHSLDGETWECRVSLDDADPWQATGSLWNYADWDSGTWAELGAAMTSLLAALHDLKEVAA